MPEATTQLGEIQFDVYSFDTDRFSESYDSLKYPDFITINRSSIDGNTWSRSNRWVHRDVIEAAARAKYVDYDAVIEGVTSDPRLAQNETIKAALLGLDNGPDVAYMLGRNLDVAYEIASLRNPIAAGMKLAELMNRAPRRNANAPTPIKPINGAAGSTPGNPRNYAEMSTAEYIAARNAEEMNKRQALYKR